MEHQLHYSNGIWAWAVFNRATRYDCGIFRAKLYLYQQCFIEHRRPIDFAGGLEWWEAAQLFGGGN